MADSIEPFMLKLINYLFVKYLLYMDGVYKLINFKSRHFVLYGDLRKLFKVIDLVNN